MPLILLISESKLHVLQPAGDCLKVPPPAVFLQQWLMCILSSLMHYKQYFVHIEYYN